MVEALAVRGDLEGAQAVATLGRQVAEVLIGQCHLALPGVRIEAHVSIRHVEVVRKIERGGE
jgi:hypothetical protein